MTCRRRSLLGSLAAVAAALALAGCAADIRTRAIDIADYAQPLRQSLWHMPDLADPPFGDPLTR